MTAGANPYDAARLPASRLADQFSKTRLAAVPGPRVAISATSSATQSPHDLASGSAASGFAFAAAIGRDQPRLGLALRFLAAAVAYSQVHTGMHYPGHAVVGSLIGEGTRSAVGGLIDLLAPT